MSNKLVELFRNIFIDIKNIKRKYFIHPVNKNNKIGHCVRIASYLYIGRNEATPAVKIVDEIATSSTIFTAGVTRYDLYINKR